MKYPIDYDTIMKEAKANGIDAPENVREFMRIYINSLNNAYFQGRLDQASCDE